MKKIFLLCALFLSLFASVCQAECKLDVTKWQWLASTDYQGTFFDYTTVEKVPGKNVKTVWICTYKWVDDSLSKGEHYIYVKYGINYDDHTAYMEQGKLADGDMNVIRSYDKLAYNPQPIAAGSVLERLAKRVATLGEP